MPPDLKDRIEALTAVDHLLDLARQHFESDEYLAPVVLIFTPGTPGLVVLTPGSDSVTVEDKDAFSAEIRRVVKDYRAFGVLHISEAWILISDLNDKAASSPISGSISQHPDRKEAVVGRFEHLTGVWQYVALIDRTGKPTLKPFVRTEQPAGSSHGRFTGFLKQHRPQIH